MVKKEKTQANWIKRYGIILLVLGLIGFAASTILTIEKIELIKDPSFIPSCNINPILSCGSVMKTAQAEAFGFPNSLIGIAGFAMVSLLGAGIMAGATFKRWFWQWVQVGVLFGIVFVHWLAYQSFYSIGALCPYCMVVWTVMIPLFVYVTLFNLRHDHLHIPKSSSGWIAFVQRYHKEIIISWYLLIFALIIERFWYYWQTLI